MTSPSKATGLVLAAVFSAAALPCLAAQASPKSLQAQATVTESAARATALTQAPGATVQSAELENEHGKLIWSFDLKHPKSANVVEVQVDAKTGQIASKTIEAPRDQAREAAADKAADKATTPGSGR